MENSRFPVIIGKYKHEKIRLLPSNDADDFIKQSTRETRALDLIDHKTVHAETVEARQKVKRHLAQSLAQALA